MPEKKNVSINAENIMPVIKKWLYSDKDIFLRELVSNGCDAISKYKRLMTTGDVPEEDGLRVDVICDEANGALKICDNGIGMTADEVEKYISQVAFSGAEDFMKKYADSGSDKNVIIGHFGLGFYSAFMVSRRVQIDTLSYQEGAQAVRWLSDDGMAYELDSSDRTQRGTTITLYLNEEDKEFLKGLTVRETLEKYCAFMPVEIYLSEAKADAESAAEAELINDTNPLWLKKPSTVTEEEYISFYQKTFHDFDKPLFWIHLNAEFPFNLKGILYFPKLKNEFTASEGVIKLFNNQVFVADNIKEVIPEFLMLLKGVVDCPDLPLNVSRSFLQNDGYVKKMSAYITRKVADRLLSEFNNRREDYQRYWDDIHPFVKYGCIRDEKFYDQVKKAILYKTTGGEYLTMAEYRAKAGKADDEEITILYTSDAQRQANLVEMYVNQGRDVVELGTLIDTNFISFIEYSGKEDKIRFVRVDADTSSLTQDGETSEDDRKKLEDCFRKALEKDDLDVQYKPFKDDELIAMVTVDEQSRRFSEMSRQWGRDMMIPEKRTLIVNSLNPVIDWILACEDEEKAHEVCCQVADLAEMARQPLDAQRMTAFLKRSNKLLGLIVK